MTLSEQVEIGGLIVQPREHVVLVNGSPVDLTSREFEMIEHLVEHPGWVLSAEQLSLDVEGGDYSPESVSVLMSRVRRKLEGAGAVNVIETVRGLGYRMRTDGAFDGERTATTDRALRDAMWHLQEAVVELEHIGSEDQRRAATEALEDARRSVYNALAE